MSNVVAAGRRGPLTLLLDYDGTLVPIAPMPNLAKPDAELVALLDQLAGQPQVAVHIVSGRPRATLEGWLGALPLTLWAEHGFWHRAPGGAWTAAAPIPVEALARVRPLLAQTVEATPGSFIEDKEASLAWHYRQCDPAVAAQPLRLLVAALESSLRSTPLEAVGGKKVIEIRLKGINKGLVGRRVSANLALAGSILAIGDDQTDEDLFQSMPESAITIAVGSAHTSAKFEFADPEMVRSLLRTLIA